MSSKSKKSTPSRGDDEPERPPDEPPAALEDPDHPTSVLLRDIWDRMNKHNEHFVFAMVGREGSGKSYTAVRVAQELDPTFTHERIMFDIGSFLEVLRDGDHAPGQVYVLDEAGVSMGKRTWQDRSQVLSNQALQLIRDHNLGLIFTLPRLGELDSQAVARLHGFYEILKKRDGEFVRGKWKWIDPDRTDTTGENYKKLPKRREDGRLKTLNSVAFGPPSGELIKKYEARKDEFQQQFYAEVLSKLNEEEDGGDDGGDDLGLEEIADKIISDGELEKYSREKKSGTGMMVDRSALYELSDYDLTYDQARLLKSILEGRKGW